MAWFHGIVKQMTCITYKSLTKPQLSPNIFNLPVSRGRPSYWYWSVTAVALSPQLFVGWTWWKWGKEMALNYSANVEWSRTISSFRLPPFRGWWQGSNEVSSVHLGIQTNINYFTSVHYGSIWTSHAIADLISASNDMYSENHETLSVSVTWVSPVSHEENMGHFPKL